MKRLGIILGLLLLSSPAVARDWYFSDCATGCFASGASCGGNVKDKGTIRDPFCLDPDADGDKDSFAFISDGVGLEMATGEDIFLCAGACDGSGSATYYVSTTASNLQDCGDAFFNPHVSGTQSDPIVITPHPGENIILSGNTDADTVAPLFDAGEPHNLVANTLGKSWIQIKGPNLTFKQSGAVMFCLVTEGAPHWTLDQLTITEVGNLTWQKSQPVYTSGCFYNGGQDKHMAVKVVRQKAPFTLTHNVVSNVCGMGLRAIGNNFPGASFTVTDNNISNALEGIDFFTGQDVVIARNTITDFGIGIDIENGMSEVTIEDNTVSCQGVNYVHRDGQCNAAISINDGDGNQPDAGTTHDITIRRNKIFATNVGGTPSNRGMLVSGIQWTATCLDAKGCTTMGALIENNSLSDVQSPFGGHQFGRGALDVKSNKAVTVQGNTLSNTRYAMHLASSGGGTPDHVVKGNQIHGCGGGSTLPGCVMVMVGGGTGAGITNNNIYPVKKVPTVQICTTQGGGGVCTAVGEQYNCAQLPGFNTGNKCSP